LLSTCKPTQEDTLKVKPRTSQAKVEVTADGEGLVSHAGTALLAELADRTGLTQALRDAMAPTRQRRSTHDPGRVLRDVVVMLCDGGECVSDLDSLANQERLFGPVASQTTAQRTLKSIGQDELAAIHQAVAKTRQQAFAAGAHPDEFVLDVDSTLVGVHSEKEGAAGDWKGGFSYHPMLCYLDGADEPLAGHLRPGNAAANNAQDQIALIDDALDALPLNDECILVRGDSAFATHDFIDHLRDERDEPILFSVGYELTEPVKGAIENLPEAAWQAAMDQDGSPRDGAWVTELTGKVNLDRWPEGTRLICRRERAHPGAQLSFTDHDGHRFTCFITDQHGRDIAALELRHRTRARVEDRIRTANQTGLAKFPFHAFAHNEVWLELILIAQSLIAWTQSLVLDGELALAEPKRLRFRLLHVAARLARSGRRTILRLPRDWPWAKQLVAAFERLRALPLGASP
jgi:hypothetical protein